MINTHAGDYPQFYPNQTIPQTWIRDDNGFLINNDDTKYKEILAKRAAARKEAETKQRLDNMEADIALIKNLLLKLVKEI